MQADLPRIKTTDTVRLGIMGGTFDPIHYGHLVCAEQVRQDLALDHVVFMPAGKPAFKQHGNIADAECRLEMTELAIRDNPDFSASRFELDEAGITYTAQTLERLREIYPSNVEFYFITGADALIDIVTWKNADVIARLAHLVGATRPGYNLDKVVDVMFASPIDFDVIYVEVPALAISSSYIRKRIYNQQSVRYLIPPSVIEYIESNGLYREIQY